ncbi:histidine ammonia-lyase [Streptomyces sulfonofaciens]|uniref:Histidine ammonia-lyase n=1 Tax=Streptomyces sulfonofaciens TaxID=68272 RepID=A0A919G8R9_9ACTN|nr:aromatic amino acid lyase [Streptomyces sulfonofaciens]GHH80257.1 histidine ammonia-lyase [Streptomyces sulfonofaciens]
MTAPAIDVARPADLGPAAVLRIAREGHVPVLRAELTGRIARRRAEVLAALASGTPVYGVNTGMGALSEQRLTEQEQARHQEHLMVARSVGSPPWLTRQETRAVLAVRLRTFLGDDSGVGAGLCLRLAEMLARDVLPAVPRSGLGSAGEIIPLAHLAAPLSGRGAVLPGPGAGPGAALPAGPALAAAGLTPLRLGPKEGVALIEGVPVTTALAVLCADGAKAALRQCLRVVAGEFALTGASRDALHPALARGDGSLAAVTREVLRLAGGPVGARTLQPPVSFRVSGQVLAHLDRAVAMLQAAVQRALVGVTDSPAYVEEDGTGRFLGTAGFHGYDLAAHLHTLTLALVGAAELGASRLHRMLDPRVTGLTAQLSPRPGPHTGLSPVHKRAVGVVHDLRRLTAPPFVGTVETSGGQEDVQSFSLEAAECCRRALDGLTDVLACELLALHQARRLGAVPPGAGDELAGALDEAAAVLPDTVEDRFFGADLTVLRDLLRGGWPHGGGADGGCVR